MARRSATSRRACRGCACCDRAQRLPRARRGAARARRRDRARPLLPQAALARGHPRGDHRPGPRHRRRFESEALVDTLVDVDRRPPRAACRCSSSRSPSCGRRATRRRAPSPRAALEQIGGVAGALARHADEVILGMTAVQRSAARRILFALVSRQGTPVRRREDELVGRRRRGARGARTASCAAGSLVVRDAEQGADLRARARGAAPRLGHAAALARRAGRAAARCASASRPRRRVGAPRPRARGAVERAAARRARRRGRSRRPPRRARPRSSPPRAARRAARLARAAQLAAIADRRALGLGRACGLHAQHDSDRTGGRARSPRPTGTSRDARRDDEGVGVAAPRGVRALRRVRARATARPAGPRRSRSTSRPTRRTAAQRRRSRPRSLRRRRRTPRSEGLLGDVLYARALLAEREPPRAAPRASSSRASRSTTPTASVAPGLAAPGRLSIRSTPAGRLA